MDLKITGIKPLTGQIELPGDKSVSHRAVLIAALSKGESIIHFINNGRDVKSSINAVKTLGASIMEDSQSLYIKGFENPRSNVILNCGNSGTTMRLLSGILSSYEGQFRLIGDESLSKRPMDRIKVPLELMGAKINCELNGFCHPPLLINGTMLKAIKYDMPLASAQVKSAILLAGLRADGITTVVEPIPTRAHTEEILEMAKIKVVRKENEVRVFPGKPEAFELSVKKDPSQAAFWVVAALIVKDSQLRIPEFYKDKTRSYFLDVLIRAGVKFVNNGDFLTVGNQELNPLFVKEDEVPFVIDEIPILSVCAAFIKGRSVFSKVSELRVKETDRLSQIISLIKTMGAVAYCQDDDIIIQGTDKLTPFTFDPQGDHRMAMAAAVAACGITGESRIKEADCIEISDPLFLKNLKDLKCLE